VFGMLKRTAKRAGLPAAISPHWLRHALVRMPWTAARHFRRCKRRLGRQHRHDVGLSAREARQLQRAAAWSGDLQTAGGRRV